MWKFKRHGENYLNNYLNNYNHRMKTVIVKFKDDSDNDEMFIK